MDIRLNLQLTPEHQQILLKYLSGPRALSKVEWTLPERALIAHCLYWWNALGKGYIFELMVFADLMAEGITFHAHDLRRREERRSLNDLVILQWCGDVKTSTYFLYVARSFPLRHDFYITRLFVIGTCGWQWVVLLTPTMWKTLDGDTYSTTLEKAGGMLPAVIEIQTRGGTLVVVDYTVWKAKVKAQQRAQEESSDGKDVE